MAEHLPRLTPLTYPTSTFPSGWNILGLSAMFKKDTILMKCYIVANLAWTFELFIFLIFMYADKKKTGEKLGVSAWDRHCLDPKEATWPPFLRLGSAASPPSPPLTPPPPKKSNPALARVSPICRQNSYRYLDIPPCTCATHLAPPSSLLSPHRHCTLPTPTLALPIAPLLRPVRPLSAPRPSPLPLTPLSPTHPHPPGRRGLPHPRRDLLLRLRLPLLPGHLADLRCLRVTPSGPSRHHWNPPLYSWCDAPLHPQRRPSPLVPHFRQLIVLLSGSREFGEPALGVRGTFL